MCAVSPFSLRAGILSAVLLLVPAASQAQFYVGAGGGQSTFHDLDELHTACASVGAVCTADDTDSGFKVFAGFGFGPYLALEGGYIDLGESNASARVPVSASAALTAEGGYVSIMPRIPIGSVGTLFARLGLSAVKAELSAAGAGRAFHDSSGTAGLVFGFGGEIHLNERLSIRAEWERHRFDEVLDIAGVAVEAPHIDLLSAGLVLNF